MRTVSFFAAAIIVAATGTTAPGCLWSEDDVEPFGRICASPSEGGEFCVRAEDGPERAWSDAEAHGSLPIQMWAEQPAEMTLDALVKSKPDLERWFATIDAIVDYMREKQSAESYKATLEGRLGESLKQAKARQKELRSEEPVDAVGHFKGALTDKANAEKDPLLAALASDKQSMGAVQEVFGNAETELAPLATRYANLVKDFAVYRATEATETEAYGKLAADASKAALEDLDGIEQAILTAALDASAMPNDLGLVAMKLSAQIQQFELASQEAIAPHTDFMATHGAALPDMTSGALRSINAMLGYMQRRVAQSDATATSLLQGVGMRRKALEMLAASPTLRAQAAEAKLQKARAAFSDTSKARVNAIKGAPPSSAKLGLPYLARRYDELTMLLQMRPLCDPASSSWREAGCTPLRDSFEDAATYLKTTLPSQISKGLATMKAAGVDAALLDAAKVKLKSGDIKAAAILHDAALRVAEGT